MPINNEIYQTYGHDWWSEEASFDIVACCDVLEHVDDLSLVIGEVARTLKPGGVFCYDTVNRTWLSKVALIKISQDWSFTRWSQPNVHG